MPFSEYPRRVARFLEMSADCRELEIGFSKRVGVAQHPRRLRVEACQHRGTAGRTLRGSTESVFEYSGFRQKSILMGRVEEWVDRLKGQPVLLVGAEIEDIGAISV